MVGVARSGMVGVARSGMTGSGIVGGVGMVASGMIVSGTARSGMADSATVGTETSGAGIEVSGMTAPPAKLAAAAPKVSTPGFAGGVSSPAAPRMSETTWRSSYALVQPSSVASPIGSTTGSAASASGSSACQPPLVGVSAVVGAGVVGDGAVPNDRPPAVAAGGAVGTTGSGAS